MGQFLIPLVTTLASAGVSAYNTNRTANKQDAAQAEAIRNQGRIQQQADSRVNEEVTKLEQSRSEDEKQQRMDQYMQQLSRGRDKMLAGFSPTVGSETFRQDNQRAAGQVEQYAGDNAGLMSRIDAPGMQRQGEAFGFGRLGTDLSLLGRESQGQNFIDQLRASRIRRNPWLDAGASIIGGIGSGMASGGYGMPPAQQGGFMGGWIPGYQTSDGAPGLGAFGVGGGRWRHVPNQPPIRLPGS